MKNSENHKKNSHCNQSSIVKINLSNLPKLSHFREIGKNLGNLIETQVLSKWNLSTLGYSWRSHQYRSRSASTPLATSPSSSKREAHRNYTIREEAGQSTKSFLWPIAESANDQGKKNKVLTKLTLVQCNLFSLSMTNSFLLITKPNPNHDLCAGMVARLLGALRQRRRHFTSPASARDNTEFIRHLTKEQNTKKINK